MRRILIALALFLNGIPLLGQSVEHHPEWRGKGQLFVGTCYQPVDRSPEQIRQDIVLMKQAGFTMVRMGDLSWDAFEPTEGQFEFAWFDQILQRMNQTFYAATNLGNPVQNRQECPTIFPSHVPQKSTWYTITSSPAFSPVTRRKK